MNKETEIGNEEVNELLTAVPSWIVRRGVSIIFLIMILATSICPFIEYPDVLPAKVLITTTNPPVTLLSKTTGKIARFMVSNGQAVKKGQVLLIIENTADYEDVNVVKHLTDSVEAAIKTGEIHGILPERLLKTGELTTAFIEFLKNYSGYQLQMEIHPQEKEIALIRQELSEYGRLQAKYQEQEAIARDEFLLSEKDYVRYTTLMQNTSISIKEFEDRKRDYLVAKRNYETIKINSINNKISISNLEKNLLQLQILEYRENENALSALNQSIRNLLSEIERWEQAYLLEAPVDGKISLFNYWVANQHLKTNDKILSIIPLEKQEMIAKLFLPAKNSARLKEGQTVNIKLDDYAYQEYGMLKGIVKNISAMPEEEMYAAEAVIPDQLLTSYHKQLNYKAEMRGSAEIITEERSVFERIFYLFRKTTGH